MLRAHKPPRGEAMAYAYPTHPVNVRLPEWAFEVVEKRRESTKESRTDVIVAAIDCLREKEIRELMAEGYREQAEDAHAIAESMLSAAAEILPEW
jgi:hypothetical protein